MKLGQKKRTKQLHVMQGKIIQSYTNKNIYLHSDQCTEHHSVQLSHKGYLSSSKQYFKMFFQSQQIPKETQDL